MARNKGDKDYSKSEKQLLISLINDYSLIGSRDHEIIQMLSKKIGKKISETLFYRLKKEAVKIRGEADEWIDNFAKYQYIEYYRKRTEELEFVQRTLLKTLIEEKEKTGEMQDKSIINQLSKTIADNSKVLGDFGMCPPVLSRIKSVLSENYFNSQRNKNNEVNTLIANTQNIESGFYLKMDNEDNPKSESLDFENAQRVF